MACVLLAACVEVGMVAVQAALAFMVVPALMYVGGTMVVYALMVASCGDVSEHLEDVAYVVEWSRIGTECVMVERADAQDCPVCLAHAESPVSLVCGHAFHEACIARWLAVRATCPMCRASPNPPRGGTPLETLAG